MADSPLTQYKFQTTDFIKPLQQFTAKTGELTDLGDTPYDRWLKAQSQRIGATRLPTYKTPSTANYGGLTQSVAPAASGMGNDWWHPPAAVTPTVPTATPTPTVATPAYNPQQQAVIDKATQQATANKTSPQWEAWKYAQDNNIAPDQVDSFFGWKPGTTTSWAVTNGLMAAPQGNVMGGGTADPYVKALHDKYADPTVYDPQQQALIDEAKRLASLPTAAPGTTPEMVAWQYAQAHNMNPLQVDSTFGWNSGTTAQWAIEHGLLNPDGSKPAQPVAAQPVVSPSVTGPAAAPAGSGWDVGPAAPVQQAPTQQAAAPTAPSFDPNRAQMIRDYWSGLQGQGDAASNVNNIVAKAKELNVPFAEFSNAFGADVAGGNQFLSQYGLRGWAKGGVVRTKYAEGDLVDLKDKYRVGSASDELNQKYAPPGSTALADAVNSRGLDMSRVSPEQAQLMLQQDPEAMSRGANRFINTPAPAEAPTVEESPLMALLSKYNAMPSGYAEEFRAAQTKANEAQQRFQDLLERQMAEPAQGPSKAELYFNLAAAFGAPTKTGSFMEGVGEASKVLGAHQKETRQAEAAARAERQKLGLTVAQANAQAAKEEAANLRTLTAEDIKDRRAMALEAAKEFFKSGQPQSEGGKAALDMGLKRGTPEYNKFVEKFVQDKFEQTNTFKAIMAGIAQQTANQGAERVTLAKAADERKAAEAKKLTPGEMKLKSETEDLLNKSNSVAKTLAEAFKLNPNTFDTSLGDRAQRALLEGVGSKDTKVQNTRLLEQMLKEQGVQGLKDLFGGNPTEGERAIILELQGVGAKSVEERGRIIMRAYKAAQNRIKQHEARLADIKAGKYRETTPESATQGEAP